MCVFPEEGGEVSNIGDARWIRGHKARSVSSVGAVRTCMVVERGLGGKIEASIDLRQGQSEKIDPTGQ